MVWPSSFPRFKEAWARSSKARVRSRVNLRPLSEALSLSKVLRILRDTSRSLWEKTGVAPASGRYPRGAVPP